MRPQQGPQQLKHGLGNLGRLLGLDVGVSETAIREHLDGQHARLTQRVHLVIFDPGFFILENLTRREGQPTPSRAEPERNATHLARCRIAVEDLQSSFDNVLAPRLEIVARMTGQTTQSREVSDEILIRSGGEGVGEVLRCARGVSDASRPDMKASNSPPRDHPPRPVSLHPAQRW